LVERHEEDGDRRARIIVPTGRGLSIVAQVEAVSYEVRNATLAGPSDEELEIATRVLEQICLNLAKQQG
jgi:MarR family transcriptional regulator for hemolysin